MKRELRSVPRYFLLPPVDATVDGIPVRIVDMGLKGARIELPCAIQPGKQVQLRIGKIVVTGALLWCQVDALNFSVDDDGYLAGINFEKASTAIDELLTDISGRGGAIRIEEMRSHDRYRITAPLTGSFGEIAPVSIVDLSVAGARVAMLERVAPGYTQSLRFQVDDETGPVNVTASVMWCKPSPLIREHYAGLNIEAGQDVLRAAIDRLCTRNEARIELDSLKQKFDALRLVSGLTERPRKVAVQAPLRHRT